ncbi:hypothetical protein L6452_04541 [Arctium lappa]|uniref:Uncharacterized protein n=1 Tax=Arctium lappa TaxID=4217 RepID=A0ACB9EEI9_ARCLA|nr:hypothetical protein L6452_04541 [Arctium lappa]
MPPLTSFTYVPPNIALLQDVLTLVKGTRNLLQLQGNPRPICKSSVRSSSKTPFIRIHKPTLPSSFNFRSKD